MEDIILNSRYAEDLSTLSQMVSKIISERIAKARTTGDFRSARRALSHVDAILATYENRFQGALMRFAAGDHSKDNECPFHFVDYKPYTCSHCAEAEALNKQAA